MEAELGRAYDTCKTQIKLIQVFTLLTLKGLNQIRIIALYFEFF